MNFQVHQRRDRRSLPIQGLGFGSIGYTIANYSTNSIIDKQDVMKPLQDDILNLNRINCIPDPLKKNLADTIDTGQLENLVKMPPDPSDFLFPTDSQQDHLTHKRHNATNNIYSSLQGISSFFSNVFGVITGSVFQRRVESPVSTEYYDCFDSLDYNTEMPPPHWQSSRIHDQNKNLAPERNSAQLNDNMSDYRATVAQCEQKLTVVKGLLSSKNVVTPPKFRRKPKKLFVEPGSVQESSEDTFVSDDYISVPNGEYIEYVSVQNNPTENFGEIHGVKVKVEEGIPETDIVKVLPESEVKDECKDDKIGIESELNALVIEKNGSESTATEVDELCTLNDFKITLNDSEGSANSHVNQPFSSNSENNIPESQEGTQVTKQELILSCEDKMAKLKSLLQQKRKKSSSDSNLTNSDLISNERPKDTKQSDKPTISIPNEDSQNERFKSPHCLTDKCMSKLKENIHDDMGFGHEIDSSNISKTENSPINIPNLKHLQIPQRNCARVQNHAALRSDASSDSFNSKSSGTPDYFDELKGRFHSASTTDSDDSFQIVFADSPKRCRQPSDCDSEDSFIVFDDSADSCYTSHDVFGDHKITDSESDSEAGPKSDSGCDAEFKLKLSQHLSKTVSDLTDDSLYEGVRNSKDELDCAVRICEEIPNKEIVSDVQSEKSDVGNELVSQKVVTVEQSDMSLEEGHDTEVESEDAHAVVTEAQDCVESDTDNVKRGLLLDEAKKLLRKQQPKKKVSFSPDPPKVRVMRVWAFAARQARAGHWERHALDRERFKRRIADVDMAVSWVLKPQHRKRVMFQRFMPWWNHLKRLEIAEKKRLKEEEELRKKEEEERRIKEEEERIIKEEEERKVREEEERIKEEQKRLNEEEKTTNVCCEPVCVNDKVDGKNDANNLTNGKLRLLNNKYNKPRSVYLKQKTKKSTPNVVNNNKIQNCDKSPISNSMKSNININSLANKSSSDHSTEKIFNHKN